MASEDDVLNLHRILRGKIQIQSRIPLDEINQEKDDVLGETLSLIYTPGVAEKIQKNKGLVYDYTSKWNTIAIICDGTRVLGLGDIVLENRSEKLEECYLLQDSAKSLLKLVLYLYWHYGRYI